MINGINHITFAVSDLNRSLAFYVELLGLRLVAQWQQGAYLQAGATWIALNVDRNKKKQPASDYTHVAFNVLSLDYHRLKARLEDAGVDAFKENTSEGESFYFLDPDGHKLELHYHTLEHRLSWAKENHWPGFMIASDQEDNQP